MISIDKKIFDGYFQDNFNRVGAHYKITASKEINKDILSYIFDAFYYKKYKSTDFVIFVEFDKFNLTQFIHNEIRYINLIPDEGKENLFL